MECKIVWNIPNVDATYKRIDDLTAYIENFPESPLCECFQNEIGKLKKWLEEWSYCV